MPNNREPHEDYAADLSKRRGVVAAGIADPDKKKKFIAAQGSGASDESLETSLAQQRNKNVAGEY